MKPRKIETIIVQWSRFGIPFRREFNSARLADELVASLVRDAATGFVITKVRKTSTTEWLINAA